MRDGYAGPVRALGEPGRGMVAARGGLEGDGYRQFLTGEYSATGPGSVRSGGVLVTTGFSELLSSSRNLSSMSSIDQLDLLRTGIAHIRVLKPVWTTVIPAFSLTSFVRDDAGVGLEDRILRSE